MTIRRVLALVCAGVLPAMLAVPMTVAAHPHKPPHHPTKMQRPANHPTKTRPANHPTNRRPPHHPTKQASAQ